MNTVFPVAFLISLMNFPPSLPIIKYTSPDDGEALLWRKKRFFSDTEKDLNDDLKAPADLEVLNISSTKFEM